MTPIVQMSDVHKAFHTGNHAVNAIQGVDLTIETPGFYAIMGPSGSGKSTLLHLLAALDRPDRGRISIGGIDIHTLSEGQLTRFRRHRIGIIFQRFNLIPTLTARENVALPALLDGMPSAERLDRAQELLEQLDMVHRADHRPDALSGGEQQRVAIARALVFSPPILFADEPTGNLDSQSSQQLWQVFESLTEHVDLTVIIVTHEPEAAIHCRHVFLLRDGKIDDSFDTGELDVVQLATRAQQSHR